MFSKRSILLILFCVLFFLSKAQQLSFIKYTVYDGLVANPVRCIYQDRKGFIWIGTVEGLSRYDGYKFTNYTTINGLSHNYINSIFEVDDKLLVAENNGAIDVFQNNSMTQGYKAATAVNIINPFNDQLLLTSDGNGFYEYKKDTIILPHQEKNTFSLGPMLPLGDSLLLTAGIDNHIFIYTKDLSIAAVSKYINSHIYALFEDSKKRIWACTSHGLKLVTIQTAKEAALSFGKLPTEFDFEPLKTAGVTSMIEEQDGSFWIATLKGLVHLFPDGNFQVYNEKDGLPSARIQSLYLDKEKNLWIGTMLGLAKWVSRNNVVFFNTETQDFRNDVVAISSLVDQEIILRTDHGLQNFNFVTREFKNIEVPDNYRDPVPIAGTSPLLIHYDNRIGMLNNETNTVIPYSKVDTPMAGIISSVRHPQGTIFSGTFGGLYAINKSSVKKITPYRITSLAVDMNGHIWVSTWSEGFFRITIKNSGEELYDTLDLTARIKEKQIRGLYVDRKNNIWVGTRYGGAFCLTPKENDKFDIQHFNRQSGLMSDWVLSFAETKTDDIWVGSHFGIDKLVKEVSGYRVFNFSKAVNFFGEIKKILPLKDDNWVCLANTGIGIFKDAKLHHQPPLLPRIFTTSLGTLENKLTVVLPTEKLTVRPNQNAARFEFGALGFMNERQILYSYRLMGSSDTSWSKPENIHEASYASLSPGDYTFEVKAVGWNGEYSLPASFSFFISRPFWKQWWFIALCILAIAVFFYALYRYRINQLLRLQTVRNNIATDLHDDIGSSLTNISILSELSSKNISQPEKAQPFLQRISEEVQASSQAMDDIIWSVNSRNDSLQETMARMRRYAAELFDNSDIKCHLALEENAGNKKLTMEERRDVYLIYKEALNNIHKHAEANNVWINVSQNQNYLLMKIKDDGKGFNTDLVTHRNGFKNLRSRV
jgi:ligand-binding sensor domain-containing protein